MAPTVICFEDSKTIPPVYVAGSFSDWQVTELEAVEGQSKDGQLRYRFEKTIDLPPGTYQYKFRLGPGDWWVCDSQKPKAWDSAGNENNVLIIGNDKTKTQPPELTDSHQMDKHQTSENALSNTEMQCAPVDHTSRSDTAALGRADKAPGEVKDASSAVQFDLSAIYGSYSIKAGNSTLAEVASASHPNVEPKTPSQASREPAGQQLNILPKQFEDAARTATVSSEEPQRKSDDKQRLDPADAWLYGNFKRLMKLIVVLLAVPMALAYYLKKMVS